MDKLKLVEAILNCSTESKQPNQQSRKTFLEVSKVYAFRTITMIYTGRLIGVSDQEFLIDEAAWIPETERWADFVDTGAHKEAEPYKRPVVLSRGAILDITEIPSVIRKQK